MARTRHALQQIFLTFNGAIVGVTEKEDGGRWKRGQRLIY